MRITPQTKLVIDAVTMACIQHWTNMASGEFSCLATVSDTLVVTDPLLLEQKCTGVSTDMDQGAIAKVLVEHDHPEKIRAFIHSHVEMPVYWSEQDEETIEALANETFLLSIVVNKKGAVRCRIDVFKPVRVTLDQLPFEVRVTDAELELWCQGEFNARVTEQAPAKFGYLQSRTDAFNRDWPGRMRRYQDDNWPLPDDWQEGDGT